MRRSLLLFLTLAACGADETISGFTDPEVIYTLTEMDGAPWTAGGTITFPEEGSVIGQAPCNRYFANQHAPYPWIELDPVAATKMACPALAEEQLFLEALKAMRIAEVSGGTIILSNDGGGEMVFRAP